MTAAHENVVEDFIPENINRSMYLGCVNMPNKPDVIIGEDSVTLVGSGESPVVDIEGGNHWNLSQSVGDLRIGDDDNMIKMGVALDGGGAGNGSIWATSDLRLGSRDETIVSIDTEGVHPHDENRSLGKRTNPWRTGYTTHLVANEIFGFNSLKLGHQDGTVLSIDDRGGDFDGDVRPNKDIVKLGTSDHRWFEMFADRGDVNNLKVNEGVISTLIPKGLGEGEYTAGTTPALGSEDSPWSKVYADEVIAGKTSTPSDRRLKTDIKDLNDGLETLLDLRPVSYTIKSNGDETRLGLIGQEVADVLPEAVSRPEDDDGYLGINYTEIIAVLIDGFQTQQDQTEELEECVDRQQERIERQQNRIDELENRLAALEDAV